MANVENTENELTQKIFQLIDLVLLDQMFFDKFIAFLGIDKIEGERYLWELKINPTNGPDVIIKTNKRRIVIEIKLNAPFNKEQLEKYWRELDEVDVLVALGSNPSTPSAVSESKVHKYITWTKLWECLNHENDSMSEVTRTQLKRIADRIKDGAGIFDGFPKITNPDSLSEFLKCADSIKDFFGTLKDRLPQDMNIEFQNRFYRQQYGPVFEKIFGLWLTWVIRGKRKNKTSPGAIFVDVKFGDPWLIGVGIRLNKKKQFDNVIGSALNYQKIADSLRTPSFKNSEPKLIYYEESYPKPVFKEFEVDQAESEIDKNFVPALYFEAEAKPVDEKIMDDVICLVEAFWLSVKNHASFGKEYIWD